MIYVDEPTWTKPGGRKKYSHMVADTLEELHQFAESIGVKKHFWHKTRNPLLRHFDITEEQFNLAVEKGATVVGNNIASLARKMNGEQDESRVG